MSASINSIPASYYVDVIPGVIEAGPVGLSLNELMLTTNPRAPVGAVLSFPNLSAVQTYFGATSLEAIEAAVYFAGVNLATVQPGSLFFAQYPIASVGAYLRGGPVSSLTLAQLQAISGVLTITIDGTTTTSSSIDLSTATSFTSAAGLITTGLGITGATEASVTAIIGATAFAFTGLGSNVIAVSSITGSLNVGDLIAGSGIPSGTTIISQLTGTTGGIGHYLTSLNCTGTNAGDTASSSVLHVTVVASGTIVPGLQVTGSGIMGGTFITGQISGTTGGVGYYRVTTQGFHASEAMLLIQPVCIYDSIAGAFVINSSTTGAASTIGYGSGTLAPLLSLTQATGAVLSQGAIASVPATFMTAIINQTINFATFQTLFDPDAGVGNTQKQAFAAWVNSTQNQYMYICTDTDITAAVSNNSPTCLGRILAASGSSGTCLVYQPIGGGNHLAAFVGGYAASINFNATNGRATADYKSQSGIVPSVTDVTTKANLIANGYNSYDGVANRGAQWQFFDNGSVSGEFLWTDTYLNQIWLNNQCQNALMTLLTTVSRIPYNPAGYGMIRQTLTAGADGSSVSLPPASPVAAGLNNGVITPNVPLSSTQAIEVNALAGFQIDKVLSTQGWYLIIQAATAQVRQARGSPTIILLYMDGGAIQRINLSSFVVL